MQYTNNTSATARMQILAFVFKNNFSPNNDEYKHINIKINSL